MPEGWRPNFSGREGGGSRRHQDAERGQGLPPANVTIANVEQSDGMIDLIDQAPPPNT